jgi:hypothetical protein
MRSLSVSLGASADGTVGNSCCRCSVLEQWSHTTHTHADTIWYMRVCGRAPCGRVSSVCVHAHLYDHFGLGPLQVARTRPLICIVHVEYGRCTLKARAA